MSDEKKKKKEKRQPKPLHDLAIQERQLGIPNKKAPKIKGFDILINKEGYQPTDELDTSDPPTDKGKDKTK
ncbi:MAG: hypothetical protein JEY97_10290 [Bacteroidales bacterium]|nr:hypothetical protein [Bacteroidales bacterium]